MKTNHRAFQVVWAACFALLFLEPPECSCTISADVGRTQELTDSESTDALLRLNDEITSNQHPKTEIPQKVDLARKSETKGEDLLKMNTEKSGNTKLPVLGKENKEIAENEAGMDEESQKSRIMEKKKGPNDSSSKIDGTKYGKNKNNSQGEVIEEILPEQIQIFINAFFVVLHRRFGINHKNRGDFQVWLSEKLKYTTEGEIHLTTEQFESYYNRWVKENLNSPECLKNIEVKPEELKENLKNEKQKKQVDDMKFLLKEIIDISYPDLTEPEFTNFYNYCKYKYGGNNLSPEGRGLWDQEMIKEIYPKWKEEKNDWKFYLYNFSQRFSESFKRLLTRISHWFKNVFSKRENGPEFAKEAP